MDDTLVLRGADGRTQPHDKPVGVFFCGDPQTDTLLPASLKNGFALEDEPGRIGGDLLFPFFDMTIKLLADDSTNASGQTVGERIMGIVTASLAGGPQLDHAIAEHLAERNTFSRNRVDYPYNFLRDFENPQQDLPPAEEPLANSPALGRGAAGAVERDEAPRLLRHVSGRGNIVRS